MNPNIGTSTAMSTSQRSNPPRSSSGILLLDKPAGPTSHAVVDRLKRWLKLKKVGHCGTLDPFATGVLVVCVNQATRIADQLLAQEKQYRFTLRLGIRTDTQDRTGTVTETYSGPPLPGQQLQAVVDSMLGAQPQRVPKYAAVKVDGKRLYTLARAGIDVDLPIREITIHRIELLEFHWPDAVLEVHSSKGTYIRQLAEDIGLQLGCGAHVTELNRLASGPFHLDGATAMETFRQLRDAGEWTDKLISIGEALNHLPKVVIDDEQVRNRLLHGQLEPDWEVRMHKEPPAVTGHPVRLMTPDGALCALWWPNPQKGQRRLRVFNPPQ